MRRRLTLIGTFLACLLILPLALAPPAPAAGEAPFVWTPQGSADQRWALLDAAFADSLTGWVVGEQGTILRTVDSGQTWDVQPLNTNATVTGIACASPLLGWAVNFGGILHTFDGGATWGYQADDPSGGFTDVEFVDSYTGWVIRGGILHTTDGGLTWPAQTLPAPPAGVDSYSLAGLDFADTQNGWAVGGVTVGGRGIILHTQNGGTTWAFQDAGTARIYDVYAVDASTSWAVGEAGTILHTTDGGARWTPQVSGFAGNLFGVAFVSSSSGWAVGESGTILRTSDGGATWAAEAGGTATLHEVTFASARSGWAVGANGTILHGEPGVRLTATATPAKTAYKGLVTVKAEMRDGLNALVPGRTLVLQTSADGSKWSDLKSLSSSTGQYVTTTRIKRKTFFRWSFAGDDNYVAGVSPECSATCRASLTSLAFPSVMRKGVWYQLSGYLKPQHPARQAQGSLTVFLYKYVSGSWRLVFTVKNPRCANVDGATRYSVRLMAQSGDVGRSRTRTMHQDADHVKTYSPWRYYVVR